MGSALNSINCGPGETLLKYPARDGETAILCEREQNQTGWGHFTFWWRQHSGNRNSEVVQR